jgi:CheY-like chemotaxis protein
MLDLLDAATELAENGRAAIEKTNEWDFDIIFMDCQMPVMDGFEAAVEIRKREAQNNAPRTPIIALTAGGNESERGRALAAGMDDYITKPFTLQDLKVSIERFVEIVSPTGIEGTRRPDDVCADDLYGSTSHYQARNETLMGIISIERQTGNRILPKLLRGLREQSEVKVSELRHAIQTTDRALLRTSAHAIKSMSASVGAEVIRSKFEKMEKNYQTIDFPEVEEAIEDLPTLIDSYESDALNISEEALPEFR